MPRTVDEHPDERPLLLSTLPPTHQQEKQALVVALLLLVGFLIAVIFRSLKLPEIDSFVPIVASITFVNDLITATLLFSQFSSVGSRALYVLAIGYLLSGLLMIPYVLTFPGAFSPTGLLNAGLQSTVWIFVVWHLTPPITMLAYVLFKDASMSDVAGRSSRSAVLKGIVVIVAAVCGLTWLVTAYEHALPAIMQDRVHATALWHLTLTPLMISLNIFSLLLLWRRRQSVLDLWLLVASFSWLLEAILLHFIDTRWAGNWYIARVFWIVSSSLVLLVLLQENTNLYARVVRANAMLKRERDHKLLNAQAITASIAHEVRQPLGSIVASGETALIHLARTPPDTEGLQRSLNRIVSDGYRASEVFESIRTLFGKGNDEHKRIDLNPIVLEVIQVLRRELRVHQVDIRTELEAGLPFVKGHEGQVKEVLINLVSNALEAMAETTGRERVLRLMTRRNGHDTVSVAVEDSGPGIDPDKIDGAFNAFVTTKTQGTGLGLAICRMIIEQHGGVLNAWSDGKSGASFQFTLPIERTS